MDEREPGRAAPLVCITDGKHHISQFLREALGEYNFTLYECVETADLDAALDARAPDLIVLGLTAGYVAAGELLEALAAKNFDGSGPSPNATRRRWKPSKKSPSDSA